MRITKIKLRELTGTLEHEGEFWEERLNRPLDVYPEHRAEGPDMWLPENVSDGVYRVRSVFVEIETDEGVTGIGGPIHHELAYIIDQQFRQLLVDEDPTATERLWDKMYRLAVHGRKGPTMMAISAIDCALWDLRGNWLGVPVYRLLGGPVRKSIPAYASALGFSLAPDKVRERARGLIDQGYTATKWFPRWGPTDGRAGLAKIVELAETLREAIGPDNDFMLDAWMSWDVPFTVEVSRAIEHTGPRWLEEPVPPDMLSAQAEINQRSLAPISTGEHDYTRWGLKLLMDAGACEVLQPDTYWAGGISELTKISAIASTYGHQVIPHGHSVPANLHLSAAWPIPQVPLVEYLIKWQTLLQHFWKDPLVPVDGMLTLPEGNGMGMVLDPDKIERERILSFDDAPLLT